LTLFRQPPAWSPLTLRALLAGIRAAWGTGGRMARAALEADLTSSYDSRRVYLTDSGTSALTLALQVAHASTDAPVALPAYCCYDMATAADGAATPFHLYDLDPRTLGPDLDSLRRAFEAGARTVVVAHLYGLPVDLARVQALAAGWGAVVIEDAAQGSGCEWQGRPAGAHGDLGVLSFGRGKGVTGGRGGALLMNAPRLLAAAERAWDSASGPRSPRGSVRDLLLLVAQWLFGRPSLYWVPASFPFLGLGETVYRPSHPVGGISALAAGVLGQTRPLARQEALVRRETAIRIQAALSAFTHFRPPEGWVAGWLRYPLVLQRTAEVTASRYYRSRGVTRGYPGSIAELPGFGARRINAQDEFGGADELVDRLITIPSHRYVRSARVPAF
jgi:dTDP-4-amino-4,6-dideoxygalactose transaminase